VLLADTDHTVRVDIFMTSFPYDQYTLFIHHKKESALGYGLDD